ncbi:hypothetical protein NSP03_22510, partial [Salmonella enterica]|nr:hypothetical protein [Salmonella enterica]MCR2645937.1 hypothetical protein [Salmonella enterica]MCR2650746.1 hypothetical protein [Salmonella enterica]MCR2655375.1 hypothetical protein [Salmonella enterica]MCR2678514.1 hypothetical protein [Salmonella enterica]
MYQRCFDSAAETIFEQDKTPRFSRFVISDDPNWESGHHMHDNETELIYVKKGIARLIIDSSLYGFAPIFPDTCYHLTHYWPAAADIPV